MEVKIDSHIYVIEKANIDVKKYDYYGSCDEYDVKSYVIIEDDRESRVRILWGISDDNNHRNPFDPLNYSKFIHAHLEHGDECYIEDLYKIISTTNKSGEVYYDHLDDSAKDWNPEWTFGFKNGIIIHKDLINL